MRVRADVWKRIDQIAREFGVSKIDAMAMACHAWGLIDKQAKNDCALTRRKKV